MITVGFAARLRLSKVEIERQCSGRCRLRERQLEEVSFVPFPQAARITRPYHMRQGSLATPLVMWVYPVASRELERGPR